MIETHSDDVQNDEEEADSSEIEARDDTAGAETDLVDLPSGLALDVEEATLFVRRKPAKFITIVGEKDSGKTTLIGEIYAQFRKGSFANCMFAGSETPITFDIFTFLSRAASGRRYPDTRHTSLQDGLAFLHLSLDRGGRRKGRHEIIMSDRSGETYKRARNKSSELVGLIEVDMADLVVLLLDGKKLTIPAEREGAMHSVRQNLQAFCDYSLVDTTTPVQVVTSKIDLLNSHEEKESIKDKIRSFQEEIQRDFEPRVRDLKFLEIAARDPTGEMDPASGIDILLTSWLEGKPRQPIFRPLEPLEIHSEFDLLLTRTCTWAVP